MPAENLQDNLQNIADRVFGAALQRVEGKENETKASGQIRVNDILHAAKAVTGENVPVQDVVNALKNAANTGTPNRDMAALASAIRRWDRFSDLPEETRVAVSVAQTTLAGGKASESAIKLVESLRSFVKFLKTFKKEEVRKELITSFEEIVGILEDARDTTTFVDKLGNWTDDMKKLTRLGATSGFEQELCDFLKKTKFLKKAGGNKTDIDEFNKALDKFSRIYKSRNEKAAEAAAERTEQRTKQKALEAIKTILAKSLPEGDTYAGIDKAENLLPIVLNSTDPEAAIKALLNIFAHKDLVVSVELLQRLYTIAVRGESPEITREKVTMLRGVLLAMGEHRLQDPLKQVFDIILDPNTYPVSFRLSITQGEGPWKGYFSDNEKPAAQLFKQIPQKNHLALIGELAKYMSTKNLWNHEGCFRLSGSDQIGIAHETIYKDILNPASEPNAVVQVNCKELHEDDVANLFKRCLKMGKIMFATEEEFIAALKNDTEAWKAVSGLINQVAQSPETKMGYKNLTIAIPDAAKLIKAVEHEEAVKKLKVEVETQSKKGMPTPRESTWTEAQTDPLRSPADERPVE